MRINTFFIVLGLLLVVSCSKQASVQSPTPTKPPAQHNDEKHYPLVGEVLSVDIKTQTLKVRHQAVVGFMPAMTMEFAVSSSDAALVHAGEHIKAELVIIPDSPARLEHIWPDDRQMTDILNASASALREETHDRGETAYREVGEVIPRFSLLNQEGQIVQSDHFSGKQVMLNFIYTRCPIADMCPAATLKMMTTQRLAESSKVTNIEFISISLDPTNDTPGVLKEYASARGINTHNYTFLTGPEGSIRDLLTQFGVIAEFSGDLVKHTLATLLINANGKIIWRADGSDWEPQDFVNRMHKEAPANSPKQL